MVCSPPLTQMPGCPVAEVARLGRTLKQGGAELAVFFDTGGADNGGTEAVNGLIELRHRIARGFTDRDNYRLHRRLIKRCLDPG